MLKCKICEQDVHKDKLSNHSLKCKEVAELKEGLSAIRLTMENFEERANLMKNSLETNAVRQKRLRQKRPSRGSVFGDLNLPGTTPIAKEVSGGQISFRNEGTESELNMSEEDIDTPTKLNRTFTVDPNAEPVKRMSAEEYSKFIEEVKKSIFALKKVIHYANKVADKALEIGQLDDPDRVAYNELEIIYKQIFDTKVSEFMQDFMSELLKYIDKKAEYVAKSKKLAQIGYDNNNNKSFEEIKNKFKANKSSSYKKNTITLKSGVISSNKFKEDESLSQSKDNSRSPSTKKKTVNIKVPEFATPFINRRTLIKQVGLTGLLQSPSASAFGGTSSNISTPKTQKAEMTKPFLQINSNHIGYNLHSLRKNVGEEGMSLKDQIKLAVTKSDANLKIDQKSTSTLGIDSSFLATPTISPKALNSPLMSPNVLSPHLSKLAQYREMAQQRKSRFSTNTNPLGLFKTANAQETPVTKEVKAEDQKNGEGNKAKNIAKKRPKSLDLLKALHNEENLAANRFPSLMQSTTNSPLTNNNNGANKDAAAVPNESDGSKSTKHKKKKSDENVNAWESPSMRGYYSDNNQAHKKDLRFLEPTEVSISDFVFKKFLGKGAYGTVWLVQKKATGDHYAMKIVDFANRFTQNRMLALKAEKDIYEVLQGDFVVKAIWTFHHQQYICFVTEYMVGGDFNKIFEQVGRLDKEQAQFYFGELVLAVESLHSMGIVHRDLKPDNILMDAKGHIRLTDFGLSQGGLDILRGNNTPLGGKKSTKNSPIQAAETLPQKEPKFLNKICKATSVKTKEEKLEFKVKIPKKQGENIFNFLGNDYTLINVKKKPSMRRCSIKDTPPNQDKKVRMIGTPDYMAPEVINPDRITTETYNERCMDWWSMGVILYEFLVGIPPFNDESRDIIFDNILNLRMEWPPIGDEEDCIPADAVSLIKALLNPDPSKRLGAKGVQEIKNHEFFKGFQWEGLRERPAPIIPCAPEMDNKEENIKFPFGDDGKKKNTRLMHVRRSADLQAFRLNRVDVLHKMNQEHILSQNRKPQK